MKSWIVCSLGIVLFGCSSSTGDLPPLGDGALEISGFLEEAVDGGSVPGVVALVTDREGILYLEAFGRQNVAADFDMRPDTLFRVRSLTKPLTCIGVMMLVEDGLIGLDDPVSKYLPQLESPEVFDQIDLEQGTFTSRPAAGEMTIRQLLSHTSGLGYSWSNPTLFRFLAPGQSAAALPLLHDPGARWTYGESTRVLGEVIEVASGQLLDTFLRNRIFRPLGMDDTSYVVLEDRFPRLVTTHRRENGVLVELPNPAPPIYFDVRGDTGLVSTAEDYARFLRMLLNDGSVGTTRLLAPETIRMMTQNQIGDLRVELQPAADRTMARPFPLGSGRDTFGFGFQITEPGGLPGMRSPGSYSWSGLENTHFWVDPSRGIAALVFMQVLPFYDEAAIDVLEGFEQRIYQSLD